MTIKDVFFAAFKNEMIWKVIDTRKPEIFVVSETWLNNSIHNSEVLPTNYEVYHQDRIDGDVLISVYYFFALISCDGISLLIDIG
jgi:hypothetical protein